MSCNHNLQLDINSQETQTGQGLLAEPGATVCHHVWSPSLWSLDHHLSLQKDNPISVITERSMSQTKCSHTVCTHRRLVCWQNNRSKITTQSILIIHYRQCYPGPKWPVRWCVGVVMQPGWWSFEWLLLPLWQRSGLMYLMRCWSAPRLPQTGWADIQTMPEN